MKLTDVHWLVRKSLNESIESVHCDWVVKESLNEPIELSDFHSILKMSLCEPKELTHFHWVPMSMWYGGGTYVDTICVTHEVSSRFESVVVCRHTYVMCVMLCWHMYTMCVTPIGGVSFSFLMKVYWSYLCYYHQRFKLKLFNHLFCSNCYTRFLFFK